MVVPRDRKANRENPGVGPLVEQLVERLWNAPSLILLVAFLAFFFGYAIGRRQGKREGSLEGARYAPLEMRRQTWEKGYCVICGSAAGDANHSAHAEFAQKADTIS